MPFLIEKHEVYGNAAAQAAVRIRMSRSKRCSPLVAALNLQGKYHVDERPSVTPKDLF